MVTAMNDNSRSQRFEIGVVFSLLCFAGPALGAGDPTRGAQVFQACMACHSVKPGEQMTGPSLANIWGRKAGTVEKFPRYSDAMKRADVIWTDATLDKWLSDPGRFIPETSMTFQGLRESQNREDIIAYLKMVSEGKAPPPRQEGGGKTDLKRAPAQVQVASMSHCGDTYTVKTAAGKTLKFWEFNLRLKTDSSDQGPVAGKPVIVGTGMQGDRAAIVFSAPGEISRFIKSVCE